MLSQTGSHIEHLWRCLYISYTHTTHQNMHKDPGDGIIIKIHLSSFQTALFSISCSHNKVDQVIEPVATLKFPYSSTLNPKILLTVNSSSKYLLSSKFLQLQSSSSSTLPKKFSSPSRALFFLLLSLSLSLSLHCKRFGELFFLACVTPVYTGNSRS